MTELDELRLAYAECSRQKNELLNHRRIDAGEIERLRTALAALVDGLYRTSWSSWQATDKFSEPMKAARSIVLESQT